MQSRIKITYPSARKKGLLILITLVLLGTFESLAQKNTKYSQTQLIVKFKKGVALQQRGSQQVDIEASNLSRQLSSMGCEKIVKLIKSKKRNGGARSLNAQPHIIKFKKKIDIQSTIDQLMATGLFEYVEADEIDGVQGTPVIPNDTYYGNRQWGLENDGTFANSISPVTVDADIDMSEAWGISQGSSSVVVAVTDTGIKLDHPEFSGRIWTNPNEIAGNGIDDDSNGYIDDVNGWDFDGDDVNTPDSDPTDDNGHGTNVAGIIGANGNNGDGYAGVDWNCKIMPLKIFHNGSGPSSNWIASVYYAVDNGADIINMSIRSSGDTQSKRDAMQYAYDNNVIIVAAMANENDEVTYYPAGYSQTIAVGATDTDNTRVEPFNWGADGGGSNYGNHIDLVAPGNTIYGLNHQSNTNYTWYWSGTSQAAPHVSGVVALMRALNPDIDTETVRAILHESAIDQLGDPAEDTEGWDKYYGYGLLNAYEALRVAQIDTTLTVSSREPYFFGGVWLDSDHCDEFLCQGVETVYYDTLISSLQVDSIVQLNFTWDIFTGRRCDKAVTLQDYGSFTVDIDGNNDDWFSFTPEEDGILIVSDLADETFFGVSLYENCVGSEGDGLAEYFKSDQPNEALFLVSGETEYHLKFKVDGSVLNFAATLGFMENTPGSWYGNPIPIQSGSHPVTHDDNDQWYTFTQPVYGTLSVSTCNSGTQNARVSMYDAAFFDDDPVNAFEHYVEETDCGNGLESLDFAEGFDEQVTLIRFRNEAANNSYIFELYFTSYCEQFDNDTSLTVSTSRYQYNLGDQAIFISGEYSESFTSSQGCDSLVTLNLTFLGQTCSLPKPIQGDTIVYTECHNSEADWYQYAIQKDGLLVIDPTYSANGKTISLYNDCDTEVEPDHKSTTEQGDLLTLEVSENDTLTIEVLGSYAFADVLFKVVPVEDGLSCDNPLSAELGMNVLNNHIGNRFFSYEFTANGTVTINSCGQSNDTYLSLWSGCEWISSLDSDTCSGETYEYTGEVGDVFEFSWDTYYYLEEEESSEFEVSFEIDTTCPATTTIAGEGTITVDNSAGDHWFEYTPVQNEFIIVTTYGAAVNQDTKISLYQNDCGAPMLTEDDNAGIYTIVQHQLLAGENYFIQFHDEKTSAAYSAIVYFSSEEIFGLTCGDAINVEPGTHTVNNSFGDQWFTYTFPTDGEVIISTCGLTDEDTMIDIQSDCSTYLLGYDNDSPDCDDGGDQETLKYSAVEGDNIKILWGDDFTSGLYDFEISFEADDPCFGITITDLPTKGTYTANNSAGDHVFSYTAEQTGKLLVSTVGLTTEDIDTYVVLDTDCDGLAGLVDSDDVVGTLQSRALYNITMGETIYIIWSDAYTSATYDFQVGYQDVETGYICGDPFIITEGTHTSTQTLGKQFYSFTMPENGDFNLFVDSDAYVSIYDDNDCSSLIASDYNENSSSSLDVIGVNKDDQFKIELDGYWPFDFTLTFVLSQITWNGNVSTEWNTAANWNGGIVPTITDDVLIPDVTNDPIISTSDVAINDLTIEDGATLIVNNDQALTVVGDITAGTGYLDLTFGASLITSGTVSGANHSFRRTTTFDTSTGKYSVIGSPVSNEDTDVLGSLVYAYDESVAYGIGNQERYVKVTTPETMNPGDAYFSAFTGTVDFIGTPNTGNIDINLTYSEAEGVNAGFNLVSNPYPSAINFAAFVAANADVSGTIYLWDDGGSNTGQRNNSDFITINSIGEVANGSSRAGDWNSNIGAAQGFFVKANTAGTLHFANAMRVVGSNSSTSFFRTSNEKSSNQTIKLKLTDNVNGSSNETLLGFLEDATTGYDRLYDAQKIDGVKGVKLNTWLEDLPMAIQGFPLVDDILELPLGISAAEAGNYTLSLAELRNWPDDLIIELEDKKTNSVTVLNEDISYGFFSGKVSDLSRFNLIIRPRVVLDVADELQETELDIQFNKRNMILSANNSNLMKADLRIVDISGQELFSKKQLDIYDETIINFDFISGRLYIVQVQSRNSTTVYKIRFK